MSPILCKSVGVLFPPKNVARLLPDSLVKSLGESMFGSETANFQWIHWLYKTLVWVFPGGPVDKTACLHWRGCGFDSLVRGDPQTGQKQTHKKMVWSLTKLISMNQQRVVRAIHSWAWWGGGDEGSFAHLIGLESIRQTASTALNVCTCMLSHSVMSDSFQPYEL